VGGTAAEAMRGVKKVIPLADAVAVVADGYWRAFKAVRALTPSFSDTGRNAESSETIFAAIGGAPASEEGSEKFSNGDAAKTLPGAPTAIEAEYRVPFLAHATMEPMSATARIAGDRCEVWTGVQDLSGGGAARLPYVVAHQDIRGIEDAIHVRLGAWRSVAHSQHGFFTESFNDELAHAAGKDPYHFRRQLLADAPRHPPSRSFVPAPRSAGWASPAFQPSHPRSPMRYLP
jgi:CO/xanthine dehydrogenase Mo-binding subunit